MAENCKKNSTKGNFDGHKCHKMSKKGNILMAKILKCVIKSEESEKNLKNYLKILKNFLLARKPKLKLFKY